LRRTNGASRARSAGVVSPSFIAPQTLLAEQAPPVRRPPA
jgi:hypothetical protein